MISKIHNIRGVGRFKDFECRHGIDLEELTLIYSENGQGKSTLADIFRSLAEGDEDRLLGRKTIGATNQFVKLQTEDGVRCFHNSRWTRKFSDILIFDEVFVNDNIYVGLSVGPEQRENLHPVIVGDVEKRGVQKEEELVEVRKKLNARRREIEKRIESVLSANSSKPEFELKIEQFVELAPVEDIDAQIASQTDIVDTLGDSDRIHSESKFNSINVFTLPVDELRQLLDRKLTGIAEDTKEALQVHVDSFSGNEMKNWIGKGTQFKSEGDDICPYCGQSLDRSKLIEHYQAIFEGNYQAFETEVSTFTSRRLNLSRWITNVKSNYESNHAKTTFWSEHIAEIQSPVLDVDLLVQTLTKVRAEMEALLQVKQGRLFKSKEFGPALQAALSRWNEVSKTAIGYNLAIGGFNRAIDDVRAKTKSGELAEAKRELAVLRFTKLRFCHEVANDCNLYMSNSHELEELSRQLTNQKEANSEAIKRTFEEYGTRLDKHLKAFGASFRIKDLVQTRVSGVLRADYLIGLSGTKIRLGKVDKNISQPSFRNVLSEGDKRTLALAFFLSRHDQLSDLSNKVFVFDDPVTSMDDNRMTKTCQVILRHCARAKQVIVLSHRLPFLRRLWELHNKRPKEYGSVTQLKIRPKRGEANSSDFQTDWKIVSETETLFNKELRKVAAFVAGDYSIEPIEIARKLRPLLVEHYASRYPDECPEDEDRFGVFIDRIKGCDSSSPLHVLQGEKVDEMIRFYEFASPFHHIKPPELVDSELADYSKEILNHIRRTIESDL